MNFLQSVNQAIDVANWRRDEEFAAYPEGARDKTLLYCPSPAPYSFLKENHRYLFKRSSPRYAEQFWVEILAYLIGQQMNISVPPAFVAYDSKQNQSGALIEWFLDSTNNESYIPGGDYCQQYIQDFDRKKGKQHNFETVAQIFIDLSKKHSHLEWKNYWAKVFTFDALTGNTDRHQDNWGVITTPDEVLRLSPVFDNGTSMGHEMPPNKFRHESKLANYVSRGWHHMKRHLNDRSGAGHLEMIKNLVETYPETRQIMLACLKNINEEDFKLILTKLTEFNIPVKLTPERATFMLKLLQFRQQRLLHELEQ